MRDFIHQRGTSLALVIVVISVGDLAQISISSTFAVGELRGQSGLNLATLADVSYLIRLSLVTAMAALWLLGRKRVLMILVIIANAYSALVLLIHTGLLTSVLAGLSAETVRDILLDVVLMGIENIVIFSIWYWILDPPGIEEEQPSTERW